MNDVKSARRVLEILRFFAETKEPASLARIATALTIPKSSCLALMETLVAEGYAYTVEGRYYPTSRWKREADCIAGNDRLLERCRPALQALCDELGETALLVQRAGSRVVCLDVIEADHLLRFSAYPGQQRPLHASAAGRALLDALPDDELERVASSLEYAVYTDATPADAQALVRAVRSGRRRGWHVNLGEHQRGTISVAVPLVMDGNVLALVVGAPTERLRGRIEVAALALQRAAARIRG
ncbi:MAG: IclR family transcriptional regulator [Burkholderiales bacterium]|nr:IclR family transcriptional regulator [Burkholderiales bacterium]